METEKISYLGIDTGGTFTDYVGLSKERAVYTGKVSSTPDDPSRSIRKILEKFTVNQPGVLVHGTTVATNALLEDSLAETLLVTNKGLEGILRVGRGTRDQLYDLSPNPSQDVYENIPVLGVPLRQHPKKDTSLELSDEDVQSLKSRVREYDPEIIAVCLVHSYKNSVAENKVADALEPLPQEVVTSSEVLPRFREFERASTTVINAGLVPIITQYLNKIRQIENTPDRILIMGSSRGVLESSEVINRPILSALSGPTAGVIAAKSFTNSKMRESIVTMDIGGTSADVSYVDEEIKLKDQHEIGSYPIGQPMVDIHTIGSGGGSILWQDNGGHLRVGPDSAGASPGPACYGQGGPPTITDANIILGRIPVSRPLSKDLSLSYEESFEAIKSLGDLVGMDPYEVSLGALKICRSQLTEAIRSITVRQGHDPKESIMVAFGGAGGLLAADVASELKINEILIPRNAGVASAFGLLKAPKFYQTSISPLRILSSKKRIIPEFDSIRKKSSSWVTADTTHYYKAECRFVGQTHTLGVKLDEKVSEAKLGNQFRSIYRETFEYEPKGRQVELVHLNCYWKKPSPIPEFEMRSSSEDAFLGETNIRSETGSVDAQVYKLENIESQIHGPAVLTGSTSTLYLPVEWKLIPTGSIAVRLEYVG